MATEHIHDLEADADEWGVVWVHCRSCNGFSQLWHEFQAEQEQQLAQAREEVRQRTGWGEHLAAEAMQRAQSLMKQDEEILALRAWRDQARALLERFASQLRESYRDDGSLAAEGFNISLMEQLQFCREVRAFLAQHPTSEQ